MVIRLKLYLEIKDLYPVDVNDMYRPTVSAADRNGKRHGFLRSSNELMEFQDEFDERLDSYSDKINKFIEECKESYQYLGFKLLLLIGLPRDSFFYKRKTDDVRPHDASNYIKAIEDRIAVFTKIDDKYNMESSAIKYCSDSENWGFWIIMEPVNYMDYNETNIKEVYLNEEHNS